MHDGDGVRTTVFLAGCPLHCAWCHNPETKSPAAELMFYPVKCIGCGACASACAHGAQRFDPVREIDRTECVSCGECVSACPTGALAMSAREMTVAEIIAEVRKDAAFFGDGGGLTVSGGEPTAQPGGLLALLAAAKAEGINTCVETCGAFPHTLAACLAPLVDTFLFDVKDTDAERLFENTGARLDTVLENLRLLDSLGAGTVLRCILVPGVNVNVSHYDAVCGIFASLAHARYVEFLPYHPYGNSKAEALGMSTPAAYPVPDKDAVSAAARYVKEKGVPVKIYGTLV